MICSQPRDARKRAGAGAPLATAARLEVNVAVHLYPAREYRGKLTCMKQPIVSRSPEVMGGTAVFYGHKGS